MDSLRLTLSYFALFDTRGTNPLTITKRLREVTKAYNPENCINRLIADNQIVRGEYDYRYNVSAYIVAPQVMVPTIMWLFRSDEGKDCLRILKQVSQNNDIEQTVVQRVVMNYVRSEYSKTSEAKNLFVIDLPYLVPVFDNADFINLFREITEGALLNLVKLGLEDAYNNEKLLTIDTLYRLVDNFPFTKNAYYDKVSSSLDLYNFLAYGDIDKKKKRSTKIPETHLLTAIYESYRGNFIKALDAYKEAQRLYNAQTAIIELRGIYPIALHNFLFVLCCAHLNGNDAEHQFDIMLRRKESNYITTAILLAKVLQNKNVATISDELRRAFLKGNRMQKLLVSLLVLYTEKNDVLTEEAKGNIEPKWAVLRIEFSKFLNLSALSSPSTGSGQVPSTGSGQVKLSAFLRQAQDKLKPLLSTIYRQQVWETVLKSLTVTLMRGDTLLLENGSRLAYYMEDIYSNYCNVRLQTTLKNGSWSNGKQMPFQQFITLNTDYQLPGDILIRKRNERLGHINGYQLMLLSILPEMTENSRLYVGKSAPYSLVTVTEEIPYLVVERVDGGFQIKSNVPTDKLEDSIIITSRGASSINFINLKDDIRPYFSHLLTLGFFPSEAENQLKAFLPVLGNKVEIHSPLIEGGSTLKTVKGVSSLTLQMRPKGKDAYSVSLFCRPLTQGRVQCKPGEGSDSIIDIRDGKRIIVERSLEDERANADKLADILVEYTDDDFVHDFLNGGAMDMDAFVLLPLIDYIGEHKEYYTLEWPEGSKLRVTHRSSNSQWHATLKKNKNGWFELEGELQLSQETVLSMQQLLELMNSHHSRYIQLGDGEYVALSDKLRHQLMGLDALATRSRGHLQMSPFSAALLDKSITDGELTVDVDEELKEVRKKILDSSEYKPAIPKKLNATLRPYQVEGYQWMARLNSWGAGALLADDMGLGKTIQTISFLLLTAKEGPALVVAPASVAPNWQKEIQRFTSALRVTFLNLSANRSVNIANAKAGDVILTTYNLLLSVKEEITQKEWTTVCLDEAHVIKNRGAKTSAVCMKLKSKNRIMLTGTPVQNHLGELWNLFQFVNPGLLGSYEDFGRRFITPIEVGKNKDVKKELERIVKPFMLRRTKDKVLKELPEKTEIYQQVSLSDEEMAVYEVIRDRAEKMLLSEENKDKVSLNTLAEITRLRQAACSAKLVDSKWKGTDSKIQALLECLEPIIESGDSALVFSQFTSFLALVRQALDKAKVPYFYIDGGVSIKERTSLIESFQRGERPVFLISLKAGGLGLNLTRANYVFHLDPWWNPAIEQQATDRAHRIGQQNAVTVYHFLSAFTIEEKIKRLHDQKRDLADSILEGTDMSGKLTGKDLLEIVSS